MQQVKKITKKKEEKQCNKRKVTNKKMNFVEEKKN